MYECCGSRLENPCCFANIARMWQDIIDNHRYEINKHDLKYFILARNINTKLSEMDIPDYSEMLIKLRPTLAKMTQHLLPYLNKWIQLDTEYIEHFLKIAPIYTSLANEVPIVDLNEVLNQS
jgi:hypothetical protein